MKHKYENLFTVCYDADEDNSPNVADEMTQGAENVASGVGSALKNHAQGDGKAEAGKSLTSKGANALGLGKRGDGKNEANKMKNSPMLGKGSAGAKAGGLNGLKSKLGGGDAKGGAGSASASGEGSEQGGQLASKKAVLNKLKFKTQKDSAEKQKAEEEASRCDPCNDLKAGNGLDLGCIDWGKCSFMKPCCKKAPHPCGCFAYMCFGITFVGGLISTMFLF